jgi:hypothetical protein
VTRRILLRSPKDPFDVVSPERTLEANLIGNNSGNLIFLEAAYKLLDTRDATIDVDGFAAHRLGADRINERYDAFVVPLANAFRPSYQENLQALTGVIRRLRIPVVVLGVGAQLNTAADPARLAPIERAIRDFMGAVLDRGPSVGVRGEITAEYLTGLGFRDVEVIGCPSMFLHGEHLEVRAPGEIAAGSSVVITISPYVKAMGPILAMHRARYPHLRYIAQDLETLELLLWGDAHPPSGPPPDLPVRGDHPLFGERRVELYVDPWPWIDSLRDADIVFGSRIHGAIAGLLAGTPAIVLAHDSRTLELARYFEIPHRLIGSLDGPMDVADLARDVDVGPLVRGHSARFRTFTAYLARHGLPHVFEPGEDPTAFDQRIAATRFPSAVTATPARRVPGLERRVRRIAGRTWRTIDRRRRHRG